MSIEDKVEEVYTFVILSDVIKMDKSVILATFINSLYINVEVIKHVLEEN